MDGRRGLGLVRGLTPVAAGVGFGGPFTGGWTPTILHGGGAGRTAVIAAV